MSGPHYIGTRRRARSGVPAAALLLSVLGVLGAVTLDADVGADASALSGLEAQASPSQTAPGFVGAETCGTCHAEQYAEWSGSTHGTAGGTADSETVVAPFDGTPIVFADGSVLPRIAPGGAYEFVVERENRPTITYQVSGVIGKAHMVGGGTQGFVSTFPDGTTRFLPFDYSEDADVWFCNTAFVAGFWVPGADRAQLRRDEGWLPITPDMRMSECGDWPPARILGTNDRFSNCQNCHGSQISVAYQPEASAYETITTSLRVNCESCHGAGEAHVELAQTGALATSVDLGFPVLDTLPLDQSLAVCFECHALKRELETEGAADEYALGLPLVGDRPLYPDGRVRTFGYQQNHRLSACYLSGSMNCVDCHDPHSQRYRDVFGAPLEGRFSDGQCTACHASKAADPSAHSFHPDAGPDAVGCVSCHMPYLQHPALGDDIPYGRSDHTIPLPRPGVDEGIGLSSACAQCHTDVPVSTLAQAAEDWWGLLKPWRPVVEALFEAEEPDAGANQVVRALRLAAEAGSKHGLAKVAAINAWMDGWIAEGALPADAGSGPGLSDDVGAALTVLARDGDIDVASAAIAALHVSRGDSPDARALLDEVARDRSGEGIRVRWATALSSWAESARRVAGPEANLRFLSRAQEAQPGSPTVLNGLASALVGIGALDEALQVYLAALQIRPGDPVALVNLGLILEVQGRVAEAEAVYARAVEARPTEAVAHLNLGNQRFRAGDLAGAIASYQQAVTHDPGLSRAHFYLGVSLVNTGRPREALPALYEALEFAPDDPEILEVIRQIEAALRGGAGGR